MNRNFTIYFIERGMKKENKVTAMGILSAIEFHEQEHPISRMVGIMEEGHYDVMRRYSH